jgi:hypothetical protein
MNYLFQLASSARYAVVCILSKDLWCMHIPDLQILIICILLLGVKYWIKRLFVMKKNTPLVNWRKRWLCLIVESSS